MAKNGECHRMPHFQTICKINLVDLSIYFPYFETNPCVMKSPALAPFAQVWGTAAELAQNWDEMVELCDQRLWIWRIQVDQLDVLIEFSRFWLVILIYLPTHDALRITRNSSIIGAAPAMDAALGFNWAAAKKRGHAPPLDVVRIPMLLWAALG